jgi:uncharacterized protein (DUF1810 family)
MSTFHSHMKVMGHSIDIIFGHLREAKSCDSLTSFILSTEIEGIVGKHAIWER